MDCKVKGLLEEGDYVRILKHPLSRKDKKRFINTVRRIINKVELIFNDEKNVVIEIVKTNKFQIFLVNKKPYFYSIKESEILPTLFLFLEKGLFFLPKVIVDMGAVPHILNGADVMVPGIVNIYDKLERGQLCVVIDEKYHKPISIGKAILSREEIFSRKRGKAIKNIHYYNDKIWRMAKEIMKK